MTKTFYAYKNKYTGEFAKIAWANDRIKSKLFLLAQENVDKATLYDNEDLALANFKKCNIWSSTPNKDDWELIEVEVTYTIYNLID